MTHMADHWIKIRCSPTDLATLRGVAELLGLDVTNAVRFLAREKWRELKKSPPLPTTSKGRRERGGA